MSVMIRKSGWASAADAPRARAGATTKWMDQERRQFHWMVAVGTLLFLLPAAIARVTGWRWRPWPGGRDGYGSIVSEAREAAETYILFAFLGW